MKILYLVRSRLDDTAKRMIEAHGREHETTLVLIRDDSLLDDEAPGRVLVLKSEAQPGGSGPNETAIGYGELLEHIFENDRVLVL